MEIALLWFLLAVLVNLEPTQAPRGLRPRRGGSRVERRPRHPLSAAHQGRPRNRFPGTGQAVPCPRASCRSRAVAGSLLTPF